MLSSPSTHQEGPVPFPRFPFRLGKRDIRRFRNSVFPDLPRPLIVVSSFLPSWCSPTFLVNKIHPSPGQKKVRKPDFFSATLAIFPPSERRPPFFGVSLVLFLLNLCAQTMQPHFILRRETLTFDHTPETPPVSFPCLKAKCPPPPPIPIATHCEREVAPGKRRSSSLFPRHSRSPCTFTGFFFPFTLSSDVVFFAEGHVSLFAGANRLMVNISLPVFSRWRQQRLLPPVL